MSKPIARVAISFLITLTTLGSARAETILSCWGTVALIRGGKQVNPKSETASVSLKVDLEGKSLVINDEAWPFSGDISRTIIVAMLENRGSATLNRVTGAASIHFMEDGLRIFRGVCKSAEKLF